MLVGLLAMAGCRSSPESARDAASVPLVDDRGRTVAVDLPVERVQSLAPNLTELVFAAGGGDALVGVTTADNYPPHVDSLPAVSALPVDFEAITALNPDLVLATTQVNVPRDAETFASVGLPVYFFSFETVQDVFDAVRTLGTMLGTEAAAQQQTDRLAARLDSLRARTADAERPRVLVLIGDDTLYAFGGDSYIHTLVNAAGGHSITASMEAAAPTLSDEYVLEERPDVIIGAWGETYDTSQLLDLHPTWDVVPAVQNGRVYSVHPDLLLRPGPRLVEGAWQMAAALHPDLMRDALSQQTAAP